MHKKKIFIVEDEPIIALEISELIKTFGYNVVDIAIDGDSAIKGILDEKPDLVLLDIALKGTIDGIMVAEEIKKQYDVPIVYITAFSDHETISRVKHTQPHGFLIKPFNRRELETTLELAFYKFGIEQKLIENEVWLSTTLKSIGDGIIATDKDGKIKFVNNVAATILELGDSNIVGEKIEKVFYIHNDKSNIPLENPVSFLLRKGDGLESSDEYILLSHKNNKVAIEEKTTLIKDKFNEIIGVVLVFRDITERKIQQEINEYRNECDRIVSEISTNFLNSHVTNFDETVNSSLQLIANFLDVDFCYIYDYTESSIKHSYSYSASQTFDEKMAEEILVNNLQWSQSIFLKGQSIVINDLSEIPKEGAFEKELGTKLGIKSIISVPLFFAGKLYGLIGVCSIKKVKHWRTEDADFLRLCTEIFLNALTRNIAEKELINSEIKFRSIAEQITDGIIFYDFNTKAVLWANEAYCTLSGYTLEEIKKLSSFDIVAHDKDNLLNIDSDIVKNRKLFIGERQHRRKDSSIIYVEVNSALIDLGEIEMMVVVLRDLTQRKQSEQTLRESEEQYRTLYNTMVQGVVYQDNHGIITSANSAACKILETDLDELIGYSSFSPFINPIHENGNEFLRGEYPSCVSIHTGKTISNVVIGFNAKKSNELKWIVINSVPEFSYGETIPYRVFSTFTEITAQKKIEEQIRESEEALKLTNASKDKFFSIIAHDLKSPFLGLLGFSNILLENFDDLEKEQLRRYLTNINKTTKNVYKLIEHILEWSRIHTNRVEINIAPLNLYNSVEYAANLLLANATNKEIIIVNNIDKFVNVKADENLLNSIFENLISNAIKFSNRKSQISISAQKKKNHVEIIVKDNGVGMDEEVLNHIFRIDVTTSTRGTDGEPGTGLGLILCKDMLANMNGSIKVKSEVNVGTSFTICLPIA